MNVAIAVRSDRYSFRGEVLAAASEIRTRLDFTGRIDDKNKAIVALIAGTIDATPIDLLHGSVRGQIDRVGCAHDYRATRVIQCNTEALVDSRTSEVCRLNQL